MAARAATRVSVLVAIRVPPSTSLAPVCPAGASPKHHFLLAGYYCTRAACTCLAAHPCPGHRPAQASAQQPKGDHDECAFAACRGQIIVTDLPGLEARVCECYGGVRAEYERLFHLPQAILPSDRTRSNPATLRKRAEARLAMEKADRVAASSAALNADSKAGSQ